jgi:hypothetical protein
VRWAALCLLAGCGRIGFDALPDVPADAGPWAGWTSMYAGTWTIEGSSVHAVVDTTVAGYWIAPFTAAPPVTLTLAYRIHAVVSPLTDTGDHNIGILDGLDIATRDGQRCGFGDASLTSYIVTLDHMIGVDNDPTTATTQNFGDGLVIDATYTATLVHDATSTCTEGVAGGSAPLVLMHAPYANAGAVAVRVRGLDVSIDSVTVSQ